MENIFTRSLIKEVCIGKCLLTPLEGKRVTPDFASFAPPPVIGLGKMILDQSQWQWWMWHGGVADSDWVLYFFQTIQSCIDTYPLCHWTCHYSKIVGLVVIEFWIKLVVHFLWQKLL